MPKPGRRSPRITTALRILGVGLWLAACSGGGSGGGGGGSAAPAASTATTGETSSVTLAWAGANGPVAGYSVYVQRGGTDFKHEADVPQARATVYGEPGSQARVIVVAFDAAHAHGPISPSSVQFTFPTANASSQAASAASAGFVGTLAATPPVQSTPSTPLSNPAANPPASDDPDPADDGEESPVPEVSGGLLVWGAGNAFRLTSAALETTRLFARPEAGAQLVGVADFDADGFGDLLWFNATADLGYVSGRVLRGLDPISLVPLGKASLGARPLGAGDFDGDGYGDVLLDLDGSIFARLLHPDTSGLTSLGSSAGAVLAGIADLDANGSDDILWRTSAGGLVVWMMNGGSASASVELEIGVGFDVVGVGDFDGDGAAEVATRDPSGSVFLVDPLAAQPALATDLANAQGWTGVGAVDLEVDRSEELVLVSAEAIRFAGLPGEQVIALDPESPWQLVALLP